MEAAIVCRMAEGDPRSSIAGEISCKEGEATSRFEGICRRERGLCEKHRASSIGAAHRRLMSRQNLYDLAGSSQNRMVFGAGKASLAD